MTANKTRQIHLTTTQRYQLLCILRDSMRRRWKKIRAEQYKLIAEGIKRIDRKNTEEILRSIDIT